MPGIFAPQGKGHRLYPRRLANSHTPEHGGGAPMSMHRLTISIPTPVSPTNQIPLAAASDCGSSSAPGAQLAGGWGVPPAASSSSAQAKATARQREFEKLSESLANSEIRHEDLQALENVGSGSSGMVQKVRPSPLGDPHASCAHHRGSHFLRACAALTAPRQLPPRQTAATPHLATATRGRSCICLPTRSSRSK